MTNAENLENMLLVGKSVGQNKKRHLTVVKETPDGNFRDI